MLSLLLACTTAAAPPTLDGQPVVLADWMGAVPLGAAVPGSYALKLSVSVHAYITMEHDIWEGIAGELKLSVEPDGTFRGCLKHTRSSGSAVSRYASDDGENHRSEHTDEVTAGIQGSWVQAGEWMTLTLATVTWSSCDRDAPSTAASGSLRCLGLGPGGVLPVASLGCLVSEPSSGSIERLTLPIGPVDPAPRRPDLYPDAQRWLLLGAPTLTADWRDSGHGGTPTVTFE
jgi:hypothetical protein